MFRRRKWIIILVMLVCLGFGGYRTYTNYVSYLPTYKATVKIKINSMKEYNEAVEKSKLFAPYYKEIADANGVHYLDAALYCEPSKEDGLHLYADSHRRLGEAVYQKVLEIFGEKK